MGKNDKIQEAGNTQALLELQRIGANSAVTDTPSAKKPRNSLFLLGFCIGCGGYAQSNGQADGYRNPCIRRLPGGDPRSVPLSRACGQIKTRQQNGVRWRGISFQGLRAFG
jgi:hypothetical protein